MSNQELVLGIDLGGTNFRIGLVNKNGEILQYKVESSSILVRTEKDSLEILVDYIGTYLTENLNGLLVGIAIGFPSTVSKDKTRIYSAPNLKLSGFDHVNIPAYIGNRIKVPVFIEKDVNLLLTCDLIRMNLDKKGITLGMYIGTGFGNSIYINGEFLEGKNGVAGELGHIPTYQEEEVCGCGNTGCAEVYASGNALRKIKEEIYPETPIGDIFSLHGNDEVIMKYIDGLSIPVATEINILDPDDIVIGGGIPAMKEFPKKYFEQCIAGHTRKPYPAETLTIIYSENKQEAGVIGAGFHAFWKLAEQDAYEEISMKKIICPSMMCANYDSLQEETVALEAAGTDIFHIDIMDGNFVPNFGMGLQDVQCIRRNTDKLIDVHLMIENPGNYIDLFVELGVDLIYIHPEADKHPARTLGKIKAAGKLAGLAINPGTSIETIEELLPLIDYLMIMTVNPGFAGQKYLDFLNNKIRKIVKLKADYDFKIMADGAISPEKIGELSSLGVDGFILGTSTLFGKEEDYKTIIERL